MRLLFVGTNPGGGGTESHFVSLARALAEAGHDVSAAVRPHDFIHRALESESRIQLFAITFRGRRDLRAIHELSRLIRTLRPDWIIGAFKAEYWGVALAAKTAGVPLVLFSHLDQRISPSMFNRFTSFVRGVIVPSNYLRSRTIQLGVPESRVRVLPNPVCVERFKPDPELRARARLSLDLGPHDILLGYVGRFESAKGVQTLARAANKAMSRVPGLHVLWVGHGKAEQVLRDITTLGGHPARHHWMPWCDDVRPAYAAMDMFALPSEGTETFGRVLVEAQSCGLPVLGAKNGGIPEALIDGETGRLVPPGDFSSWVTAIADLATSVELRTRLAASARGFALRFDSRRIAAEFVQVLESFRVLRAPTSARSDHDAVAVTRAAATVGDSGAPVSATIL